MAEHVIKFFPNRKLSTQQLDRIRSHMATVEEVGGELISKVHTIITPKGDLKEVTYKSIRPNVDEPVVATSDVPELFADLQHMNLIVTNACNLSCSYCYEQHNKDYGRFTVESLKTLYDFLTTCNNNSGKLFQFFGGEPLIHKQLILDFIGAHRDELKRNGRSTAVSVITNGILLTPAFIDEYFDNDFVCMSISLDTDIADVDHREIGQEKINHIIDMIGRIPEYHKTNQMVSVRCTIAMENAHTLVPFAKRLYDKGVRAMVIHPLTMSSVNGHMVWPTDSWDKLYADVVSVINTLPGFEVQFSEGVGSRGGNNCMVGSDMIAVDASGDYSGCHFFTNQKEAAPHTILGNLLNDEVYVSRYRQFDEMYKQMFISEPQCQSCDLKGFCYQCPAGNSDSGRGQLFRPDGMCQNIVRLFLTLQDDIVKKTFMKKMEEITAAVHRTGEQQVFSKAVMHLHHYHTTKSHLPENCDLPADGVSYTKLLATWWRQLDATSSVDDLSIKEFYENFMTLKGKPTTVSKASGSIEDVSKRIFYLTMLHMVVLNAKGDQIEKPHKIVKL